MNPLIPDPANIPELPAPPIFERLLFENPWLLAVILGVVGIAAGFTLFRAGRTRAGGIAALAMLALAGLAAFVSNTVETAREQLSAQTRELVRAAAEGDVPAARSLLAENARITGGFAIIQSVSGRDRVLQLIERDLKRYAGVNDHRVLEVRAHRDGPNLGRTHVRVRVEGNGYMNFSWWRLDWRDPGDGTWRAINIEPLWIQGLDG